MNRDGEENRAWIVNQIRELKTSGQSEPRLKRNPLGKSEPMVERKPKGGSEPIEKRTPERSSEPILIEKTGDHQ